MLTRPASAIDMGRANAADAALHAILEEEIVRYGRMYYPSNSIGITNFFRTPSIAKLQRKQVCPWRHPGWTKQPLQAAGAAVAKALQEGELQPTKEDVLHWLDDYRRQNPSLN